MKSKLLYYTIICFCCILTDCNSPKTTRVEIVFFDLNNFDNKDTLLISNIDTVNKIKKLFDSMSEEDAKFPRRYQVTFLGAGPSEVFYTNGTYVRRNRKTYLLPEGKELALFESILNSKSKNVVHPSQ